ncbi:MAG TPA: 3-oxoacyl-[acyl-carrier-protein] reductase [Anaerolineae bacterium]|nr:3-oxoacyl-[acyl-carrier-protein] reductase [Anaerolineae bacterium]HID83780.1 3-oxoacyl-[acyl-carrier-protein] reductase [Anaerolineales bacterium]HIQ08626.1 3-oxoacyl-[acyl-carrier-protein] reductase [Anaerolineaceae bacterium]
MYANLPATLSLKDKVAVVTGASRGIGRAIAIELARRGAALVVNYNRSAEAAQEVVQSIREFGGQAEAFQADVSDFEQAQNLIKFAIQTFSNLHILVNNAGITRDQVIMLMSEEDWDEVLRVNLKSTFNCSKAAVRHMMRKRYGRIINITSVAGQIGNAGQTNYSASKAGQIGFTKALAREVASRNITVNAIAAGYIETDIWANVPEAMRQQVLQLIPLGRKGEPEEIAYAVAFLASDQAAYITGQILGVDGGMAMA